jgi:pre-mRNA branch site protein p14
MTSAAGASLTQRLPPEVNRILFVKSLPYNIQADALYDIFGTFGAVRQIRRGNSGATKGRAYVVYENIMDAKQACEHLSGFNVSGRYIIVTYHQVDKQQLVGTAGAAATLQERQQKIQQMAAKSGIDLDEEM